MSLIPWRGKRQESALSTLEPNWPISAFRSEFDRMFDRFFQGALAPWGEVNGGAGWLPSLDVTETEKEVTVRAEIPGVDPKELDITLSGQVLTFAGEKKEQTERKGENFYHAERRFGSFRRSVELPASIDAEKMTAEHKNGVVTIRFQKQPGATPKRITVQTGRE